MFSHLLKIQIAVALLVSICGYVLGSSLGDIYIITASIIGAIVAFIVVDRLGWIDLSGWVANVVLLFVLFYSMQNFIGGGSTAKLVSVANLLAYLQITLVFQKKTPRLIWQILILSILQMIVAAIFNLNFEYGAFFIAYFVVMIAALVIQVDFQEWTRTKASNEKDFAKLEQGKWVPSTIESPIVTSKLQPSGNLKTYSWLIFPWVLASVSFAFILFHSLPHHRQDWKGPANRRFIATGKSKQVDLNFDGLIRLSNSLIFRAKFLDPSTGENLLLNNQPYFRGMAMHRWTLNNGVTSWEAPYDHIFGWSSYLPLDRFAHNQQTLGNVKRVNLEIILEPNEDPLLFSTMPVFKPPSVKTEIEFCRDLSALTRRRSTQANDIASYKYSLTTLINTSNQSLGAWPYTQFRRNKQFAELETDSPEYRMLTEFDSERYPLLVKLSDEIASQNATLNRIELCNAFVNHFSQSNRYQYTLDYRNVDREKSLDPIEDFVSNHRQGHCEYYASALVLMLRAQGIPARYVVGFHGGVYNNLTDCYVIHGRHAHAWVEAYVPPKDCTPDMFENAEAGKGGAWITLDPTPAIDGGQSNEALDLARSIWQDYVISPDHNKQRYNGANALLMASTRDSEVGLMIKQSIEEVQKNRRLQFGLLAITSLLVLFATLKNRFQKPDSKRRRATARTSRNFVSRAISFVSPQLADWIDQRRSSITFYEKLELILKQRLGLQRQPNQTQREFASLAIESINRGDSTTISNEPIENVLENITNAFYQARFSPIPLDKTAVEDIENQIQKLDQLLSSNS